MTIFAVFLYGALSVLIPLWLPEAAAQLLLCGLTLAFSAGILIFAHTRRIPGARFLSDARAWLLSLPLLAFALADLLCALPLYFAFSFPQALRLACGALFEECLFRLILLNALTRRLGLSPRKSAILGALLFGLFHALALLSGAPLVPTLINVVCAAAFGLALSVFTLGSKSVYPAIFAHLLTNLSSGFAPDGIPRVFALACALFCIVYSVFLLKYFFKENPTT